MKFGSNFEAIFWKKLLAIIVQGIFQKLKMAITQKLFVAISSSFLYSIRMSICITKRNKNWGQFWSHFSEKRMDYSTEYF